MGIMMKLQRKRWSAIDYLLQKQKALREKHSIITKTVTVTKTIKKKKKRRGRGRPKGSKNSKKKEKLNIPGFKGTIGEVVDVLGLTEPIDGKIEITNQETKK